MSVLDSVKSRRTIRIFKDKEVKNGDLKDIIESARVAPYSANLQPLKFAIVKNQEVRKKCFPFIKYAGYIPAWNPEFKQTPTAFIAVLNDTTIKPTEKAECDAGAAIMSMILVAEEKGLGSCWLGAIDRAKIKEILEIADELDVLYFLGLGYPDQSTKTSKMEDSVKYYFDEDGVLCVPKRELKDILVREI